MKEQNPQVDQKLVAALRNGDLLAFDQLFKKYSKKLLYFSKGYLHSLEDAEELVQEVFIVIWDKRKELKAHLSFNSFLYTITFNAIRKHFRQKVREKKHLDNYLENLETKEFNADFDAEYNDLRRIADQAINQLPEKRRLIYQLSREKGLSNDEIAAQLHISKKTVENQITTALKFIREHLGDSVLPTILFYYLFIF